MATKAGSVKSKGQLSRGKTPGWTAFDRLQRQREGAEPEIASDPYPRILNVNSTCSNIVRNQFPGMKLFSSVLQPALNFQPPSSTSKSGSMKIDSNGDHIIARRSAISPLKWLKQVHDWASEDLIEDILAAADNDSEHAFAILRTMAPANSKEEKTDIPDISLVVNTNWHEDTVIGESNLLFIRSTDTSEEKPTVKSSSSAPIEPDWEDDDVYLIHRKDAIRRTRIASQHSQAASNAYLRGDHSSAHQLSLKAQEEWKAAEKLNAMAAKEILSIRNINNGMWKLDLHGLHASEAVHALKEHLFRIESKAVINHSTSYDENTKLAEGIGHLCIEPLRVSGREAKAEKQLATSRQKQTILHVITGSGNHSHGEAALPTAVRSFLLENGYRFDDTRFGVFAVRPKFRHN